jgi:hypothetical protein
VSTLLTLDLIWYQYLIHLIIDITQFKIGDVIAEVADVRFPFIRNRSWGCTNISLLFSHLKSTQFIARTIRKP